MKQTQIIAIANQKGGVGKTTSVVNIGASLARLGKKVLLVDLDAQANLTTCFGYDSDELEFTIADIFLNHVNNEQQLEQSQYMLDAEGCDLIPSSIGLASIEPSIMNALSRESILKIFLNQFDGVYDFVLVDCMPSLGMLTINALVASHSVLVPVQAQFLSAKGLEMLTATIARIRQHMNPSLAFNGILFTMNNQRTNVSKAIIEDVTETYGSHVRIFNQAIPNTVKAIEPSFEGVSASKYMNDSPVALAYDNVALEVISNG